MEKESVKRLCAYAAALILATSTVSFATRAAKAETIPTAVQSSSVETRVTAKKGTILEEPVVIDGILYRQYVVKKGDSASRISLVAVNYYIERGEVPEEDLEMFKANPDSKKSLWPAVVYSNLNKNGRFHINPGDVVKFPATYQGLKTLNGAIKANGWFSNYCKANNVYKKKKTIYIDKEEARRMVTEVYRYLYPDENIPITDDFVESYLKLHDYSGVYVYKEGAKLGSEEKWEFYEWLPTKEEVYETMEQSKTKTRK